MFLKEIEPLNDIPQAVLNIEDKHRSNLLPWNGQFSPQLVEALLSRYASGDGAILDPFMGSGTVLYEAGLLGLEAQGADINPAAVLLARVYTLFNTPSTDREAGIKRVAQRLSTLLDVNDGSLDHQEPEPFKIELSRLAAQATGVDGILLSALVVLSDFARKDFKASRVKKVWSRLGALARTLPFSRKTISALHCDARQLRMQAKTIDVVLTSPPYVNVYNYHQQYRVSTESLGWRPLQVAPSEIGSNRKHRANRFLTVGQYCLDITQAMLELQRLSKPGARWIFIVGRESSVRSVRFYNSDIVATLASDCLGLEVLGKQERVFMNRFGQNIYEDLIHIKANEHQRSDAVSLSRTVALQALERGLRQAGESTRSDVESAIAALNALLPSPILQPHILEAA